MAGDHGHSGGVSGMHVPGTHHDRGGGAHHEIHKGVVANTITHSPGGKVHYSLRDFASPNVGGAEAQEAAADPMAVVTLRDATFDAQGNNRLARRKGKKKVLTRGMEQHVINHGFFEHAAEFAKIAARIPGLVKVSPPGKEWAKTPPKKNLPWHSLTKIDKENLPDGFLEGFEFIAVTERQYWQFGKAVDLPTPHNATITEKVWNWLKSLVGRGPKQYTYNRLANTVYEVTFTVWWFKQTNVFETKSTIRIDSRAVRDVGSQSYGIVTKAFEKHQAHLAELSDAFAAALAATPPSPDDVILLDKYGWPGSKNPKHPTGSIPLPGDDEAELETDSSNKSGEDHDPHVDPDTNQGAPGVPQGELNPGGGVIGTDGGDQDPTVPAAPTPPITDSPTGPVFTPNAMFASGSDVVGSLSDDAQAAAPAPVASPAPATTVVEVAIPRFDTK